MKCMSAIGQIILLVPDFIKAGHWHVISFDKNGDWVSASAHESLEKAKKHKSWLFRHHRKLAKKRTPTK